MVLKRQLKIVQMLPALEGGGVERGTLELNRFLVSKGHQSIVISGGGKLANTIETDGGTHLEWKIGRKNPLTLHYVFKLRRFLRKEKVDILHLRSRVPAWVGYLAWRSMPMADRPRLVTTVHGFYSVNQWSGVMARGERVIAVSESVRAYIEMRYPQVNRKHIEVIHRGIDPLLYHHNFKPSANWQQAWLNEFPICRGKKILVLPGRLTRLKGHDDFLRVIEALRTRGLPVHGVIVGGVSKDKARYLEELKSLRDELGLSNDVTMTGSREDLREILAYADLSFSFSHQPESFGRTVCEALSLGRHVIGYDHGGVGEQLGALFPEGRIVPNDWKEATELAAKLLAEYNMVKPNDTFLLEYTLCRTLALYQNLVNEVLIKR